MEEKTEGEMEVDTDMDKEKGNEKKEEEEGETESKKNEGKASRSSSPTELASAAATDATSSSKKRPPSPDGEKSEEKAREATTEEERRGKRPRVEGLELEVEAQIELKITEGAAGSRLKIEKVVQKLVEERLRVLELTVFDRTLQELKERVEKIDCATKHQGTLNTLQARITRLVKKFGAANQASENSRKVQEGVKPDMVVLSAKPKQRTVGNGVRSTLYKALRAELPDVDMLKALRVELLDLDVLKVAEVYSDFPANLAPLITTMAISSDVPLVQSALGEVQEGSAIASQHPVAPTRTIQLHSDVPPPPPLPLADYRLEPTACQFVCSVQQQLHLASLQTSIEMARQVEASTRDQSSSAEWHQVRRPRLTPSRFREVCHVRGESAAQQLAQRIWKGTVQTAAMKRGLVLEPFVTEEYCRVTNTNYWPCGFIIHPDAPWLGSSPDGVVFDPTENPPYGLVEIKCSNCKSYVDCKYLKLHGNTMQLKRQHSYYWQIQGQLLISGMEWCDFVVFAEDDVIIQRIYKDAGVTQIIREKGDHFFFYFYMAVCLK
ncbi:activating transcription factor 7-interacting protein 1-like isoform X1 [Alosa sapidissima]|uniref:activating transcription factor 7-interacting protein 1-like isoform X1 n=1 Tax=Alosa sapidissima TaxID=34773 RepID=UPI001C087024|nr:activating transcription factor 7-interacting protein 1-like isoform X1 [Alosa sapidissima]